jgi:hypothetical protein
MGTIGGPSCLEFGPAKNVGGGKNDCQEVSHKRVIFVKHDFHWRNPGEKALEFLIFNG